jgi:alkyl sulfatase BDS1-like metallo-beta-lactamase superfamily hydrolase
MTHRLGELSDSANTSITTTRGVLDSIVLGKRTMPDAMKEGLITIEGDPTRLAVLFAALDQPGSLMFDILTPGEGR